jgi:putative transposase
MSAGEAAEPAGVVPTEKGVLVVSVDVAGNHRYPAGDDIRAALASADRPRNGKVAGCLALGGAGLASPGAGAATIATAAPVARYGGPLALGVAVACLDRVANGARHRQTGDRRGLARRGFRLFWTWKSRRRTGRPRVSADVRALIRTMSQTNPLWGAPRIHGELLKLGIAVCQATVARYMVRPRQPPSQTWRTFLANHIGQIMAADFFVVPTVTGRLLFVLVILAHERRRIVHVAVTDHPTATWTGQQIREAFPWEQAPRYLVRDRDHAFDAWTDTAKAMGIEEVRTAPYSPWQNAYVEKFIGSARRECLDHVIVLNATGLRRLVTLYCRYYERSRTHLSLDKDAPIPRPIAPPSEGRIVAIPEVGALHHRYERRAA